jgi:hypothetical protein
MAGANFSDVETFGLLKELYSDDVVFQEHIQNSMFSFIDRAGEDEAEFDGNYWNVPVQFQLNESYASINDNEHLPDSDLIKGTFAKFRTKLSYSTIEATTFAGTRGHKNGRPNGKYMDDLVKSTLMSFMSNLDFDLLANGRGYRATIATATPGAASFTVSSSVRIRPGMRLDWYDSTYATLRGSVKVAVKGVDRINKTVYIDSTFGTGAVPVAAAATDVLVVYGALAAGEPTDGRYVAGLPRLTDNTLTLGTLSSATYAAWAATNYNAVGANPSQEILQTHWDQMYIIAGMYPGKMAFNPSFKRAYLAPFLNQRMFTSNNYDTGATSLSFSPVKMGTDEKGKKPGSFQMLEDKNMEADSYYLWVPSALKVASDYANEPHLADEDDREFRFRLGYDSMQGFLRFWWNTVVNQRNAIGKGYGFATAAGTL